MGVDCGSRQIRRIFAAPAVQRHPAPPDQEARVRVRGAVSPRSECEIRRSGDPSSEEFAGAAERDGLSAVRASYRSHITEAARRNLPERLRVEVQLPGLLYAANSSHSTRVGGSLTPPS
jgi:hypothetical protein